MSKIIKETQIEELKVLFRNRNSYSKIKEILDNLENSPEQLEGDSLHPTGSRVKAVVQNQSPSRDDILHDLKTLVRDLGKSNMINKDKLTEVIDRYSTW